MKRNKSKFREYAEAIIIAVFLALLIRAFVVQAFKIPSGSMLETLQIGDHILVNKFIYGLKFPFSDNRILIFNPPKKGDIIVFSFPGNKEIPECTSFSKNLSAKAKHPHRRHERRDLECASQSVRRSPGQYCTKTKVDWMVG